MLLNHNAIYLNISNTRALLGILVFSPPFFSSKTIQVEKYISVIEIIRTNSEK